MAAASCFRGFRKKESAAKNDSNASHLGMPCSNHAPDYYLPPILTLPHPSSSVEGGKAGLLIPVVSVVFSSSSSTRLSHVILSMSIHSPLSPSVSIRHLYIFSAGVDKSLPCAPCTNRHSYLVSNVLLICNHQSYISLSYAFVCLRRVVVAFTFQHVINIKGPAFSRRGRVRYVPSSAAEKSPGKISTSQA